jgi:FkbH-like protein
MALSLIDLPWLPPAPDDLSARIRALATGESASRGDLQAVAGFALNSSQAASFARALRRRRAAGLDLDPLASFRLGVLASNTFDLAADAIAPAAARHGVAVELIAAPYDQVMQQALDPASTVNTARPDAVLIAVDHRWLGLERADLDDPAGRVAGAMARLESAARGLRAHGGAPAILQTVAAAPISLFGSFDRRAEGSARAMIDAVNVRILALAEREGAYVLDIAALAERVGLDQWFDPVHWYAHKLPFAPACAPVYAEGVGRLLGAIRGKARKCLVLDLDNTLWGGAIGDEGLEGIVLGQGNAAGEAFLAVQHMAASLRDRGVILAVCSRNDEAAARVPFRDHADMVLRESDITVFRADWGDKAAGLRVIASALNLGLEALVLLDDNPAERAQVRAALPMVAVPELPSDPSWYPWILSSAGYFEAVSLLREDRLRAAAYAADVQRQTVAQGAADVADYLSQLQMTLVAAPFDPASRQRIAQLVNKTNQFNLTARRYTEAQIADIEVDPAAHGLQARLADRFGDMGLIAVVIARGATFRGQPSWDIDAWLMSCRVLGRRVEEALLDRLVRDAKAQGVDWLMGLYIPTAKNGMVADHYPRLGFEPVESPPNAKRFILDLKTYRSPNLPFA